MDCKKTSKAKIFRYIICFCFERANLSAGDNSVLIFNSGVVYNGIITAVRVYLDSNVIGRPEGVQLVGFVSIPIMGHIVLLVIYSISFVCLKKCFWTSAIILYIISPM